jgi:hypothetical protein
MDQVRVPHDNNCNSNQEPLLDHSTGRGELVESILIERNEAQNLRDQAYSERDAALMERDAALRVRDAAVTERDSIRI